MRHNSNDNTKLRPAIARKYCVQFVQLQFKENRLAPSRQLPLAHGHRSPCAPGRQHTTHRDTLTHTHTQKNTQAWKHWPAQHRAHVHNAHKVVRSWHAAVLVQTIAFPGADTQPFVHARARANCERTVSSSSFVTNKGGGRQRRRCQPARQGALDAPPHLWCGALDLRADDMRPSEHTAHPSAHQTECMFMLYPNGGTCEMAGRHGISLLAETFGRR